MNKKLNNITRAQRSDRSLEKVQEIREAYETSQLKIIDFEEVEGLPVFIECFSEVRSVKTGRGTIEAVDVRILHDIGPLQEGDEYIWQLTVPAVQEKIEAFRPLLRQHLCVVYLGKMKGRIGEYVDYQIETEEDRLKYEEYWHMEED